MRLLILCILLMGATKPQPAKTLPAKTITPPAPDEISVPRQELLDHRAYVVFNSLARKIKQLESRMDELQTSALGQSAGDEPTPVAAECLCEEPGTEPVYYDILDDEKPVETPHKAPKKKKASK